MKIGKLNLKFPFDSFNNYLLDNDIELLPLTFEHLLQLTKLELHHGDPFDRIIIAQGAFENLTIITRDANFSFYDALISWH